jgi:hypothetical protein
MDDQTMFQQEVYKSVKASLEKDKRIAHLEAQNAKLLALVRDIGSSDDHEIVKRARALLVELDKGKAE